MEEPGTGHHNVRPLNGPVEHPRQAMAVQRPWGERNGYQDQLLCIIHQQYDSFGFPQGQGTAEVLKCDRWALGLV